jgi:hypothetical protein
MVVLRDLRRLEARRRRVIERLGTEQRERIKKNRINTALGQLRLVLADETFRILMHAQGVTNLPEILISEPPVKTNSLDPSLDFLIAWRFIAPLLYDDQIGVFLETRWQRLTIELRDLFIALVADGPFPHEERGRPPREI